MAQIPLQIGWRVWLDDPEEKIGSVFVKDGKLEFNESESASTDFVICETVFKELLSYITSQIKESKYEAFSVEWWEDIRNGVNGNLFIAYNDEMFKDVERPVFLRGPVRYVISKWV